MTRSIENWLLSIVHELCRRRARVDSLPDDVTVEDQARADFRDDFSCQEAERAISLALDGRLLGRGRGRLQAHLHDCEYCARYARSNYAHRLALRSLTGAPIPGSLSSFFAETEPARRDLGKT